MLLGTKGAGLMSTFVGTKSARNPYTPKHTRLSHRDGTDMALQSTPTSTPLLFLPEVSQPIQYKLHFMVFIPK